MVAQIKNPATDMKSRTGGFYELIIGNLSLFVKWFLPSRSELEGGLFDLGIGGYDKGRFVASNPRVKLPPSLYRATGGHSH